MRKIRRPLLVLHRDRAFRDRIRQAGGREYQYQGFADWNELHQTVSTASPAALIVADPYFGFEARTNGDRENPAPALRALLEEFPSVAVIAAMEVGPERFDDLRTLGTWGVVQVISIDHDDTPSAIAQRLRAARGRPLQALLEHILPPETPGRARAIIEAAADVVVVGGHGSDLAQVLRLSRRTLLRWCTRAGLPPPRTLLAWMRVLLAAELLDDPGRSVLSVAQICGYSSDSGLRRITQKFLGGSPSQLRDRGAFHEASAAFLRVFGRTPEAEVAGIKWQ